MTNPPPLELRTNPPIKEIGGGIFEFGDVRIDKRRRTVSFPARVNLNQGPMEYLLVSAWGKTYESILRTDTEPYRIHLAMLLLGVKGSGGKGDSSYENAGGLIIHPSSARLPGDGVALEVKWTANGKETRKPVEELVFNTREKRNLRKGNWVYNGSLLLGETFLAQREGLIASLVTDPQALINNIGRGHDDDSIWTANTNALPSLETQLEVTIKIR